MNTMPFRQAWSVAALCAAISDLLQVRFHPLTVRGEISGFSQAASGHCYFTLKDAGGQLRAAMFKRAAAGLNFYPQEGLQVEIGGRLAVYEQRGDLQLIVESMIQVGQGSLLEDFMRLKSKLEAEGLFSQNRKRALNTVPRGVGVVTSVDAAAWLDVAATLRRRVPHLPVTLSPSLVQGTQAPESLIAALKQLYQLIDDGKAFVDVILLVRGGGSLEDLSAFNHEQLAYVIASSPVPLISGVGHESDFSIADLVADVRAPTPTAAAELCAVSLENNQAASKHTSERLQKAIQNSADRQAQYLDQTARRLLRPSAQLEKYKELQSALQSRLRQALAWQKQGRHQSLHQFDTRLELLHPQQVLNRGFAWLSDHKGVVVKDSQSLKLGQTLTAHLANGKVNVQVSEKLNLNG